ncbi:MAG: type IVB secretion system protein IcmH/DotU [Pseudomonadota bacterium]
MPNDDRTRIRIPKPGGRRRHTPSHHTPSRHAPSRHTPSPRTQTPSYTATEAPIPSIPSVNPKGINTLVESAATLLSLASQLSTQTHDPGIAELRDSLGAEIKSFTRTAKNRGIDTDIVDKASYALCTFLDEAVMETPWGGDSFWTEKNLLVEFHGDAWGGERFFEILQEARDDPSRYIELLELMYLCLAFGFEGTYKLVKRHEVERIRQDLYEQIRRHRGEIEPALSPHWQGHEKRGSLTRHIPLWVVGVVMLALLVMAYIGFKNNITEISFPVYGQLENIQPKLMMVNLPQVTIAPKPPPPPPPPKPFDGAYKSYILKFVTRGDKLTDVHKEVLQRFIDRVNANSDYHNIGVDIIGRASPTPPGAEVYNQRLSERRAQSVRRYLKGKEDYKLPTVKIISVKGLGAYKNPLQPRNDSETFNEINQSVEVLVVRQEKD